MSAGSLISGLTLSTARLEAAGRHDWSGKVNSGTETASSEIARFIIVPDRAYDGLFSGVKLAFTSTQPRLERLQSLQSRAETAVCVCVCCGV